MKTTTLVIALVGALLAQPTPISAGFSRASVDALRSINSGGWKFPASMEAHTAHQADVKAKMVRAHDAAESEDDADAFIFLQRYQFVHSQNFADYINAVTAASKKLGGTDAIPRAEAQVVKDPRFANRKRKEDACGAALEKVLLSRKFSPPAQCDIY
ncbi:MAG TPA: hypothetical protein VHN74_03455 [Candidatus Angelobacter sp.]|jgi:hypothetical protein|nr:hypothetical protein [Candidatus Angelobacter sp.]